MVRVLAVDVGSSSVRAQLHDEQAVAAGKEVQLRSRTTDPVELVGLTRRAIGGALGGAEIAAVGAACFGHSLLALDERAQPLTPVLMWWDSRSAPYAREVGARAPGLRGRTGCFPHSSYWPAKLAWLRGGQPETFARAARFVSFAEYLVEQVVGAPVPMSVSMASSTGLLNVATSTWDEELLAALDVRREQLPAIGADPLGDPPWFPVLFDGAASNIGTGCTGRERAALTVGTSGALRILAEPVSLEPRPGLFLYRVDEGRVLEGGALSDGGNLGRWLKGVLAPADGTIADRPPAGHGLTFLPFLAGERAPWWRDALRGAVTGLTLRTTPLDLRQAALESIAFLFAEMLEQLPEVEELVATGGALLHGEGWMQVMADVLERPVLESGVEEGTSRGAAVVALERLGVAPGEPPIGRRFEPRRERFEPYRAARTRLRDLYDRLAVEGK